jgi:hypothetical protein
MFCIQSFHVSIYEWFLGDLICSLALVPAAGAPLASPTGQSNQDVCKHQNGKKRW